MLFAKLPGKTLKISVEMALVMCEKNTESCGLKKSAACQHFPPANSAGGHFWDDEKVTPSKVTLPPIIMEVKMGPNSRYLSNTAVFHFHDYGRKSR